MINTYNLGDMIQSHWKLIRLLGEGSFGRVFEAEREDFGTIYKAAIKIITIPQSQSEIISARAEGMSESDLTTYFRSFVEEIVREFALMSQLKGTANIVSYEDHTVIEHKDNIGWDILIRMELLTSLFEYSANEPFTRQTVTKLGIDICRALELCQKFNVIHRDIKPENIFVSKLGDFKIGDFGIARTVEKTTSGLSKKGTYTYMAPEIYRGDAYGSSVDIYSLGIVLYRLLNDNRAPFLPDYPAPISHSDREASLAKRISGAVIPNPKNADGRLAEIVLKACAYNPKDRYSSPMQMRQELEAILYNREEASIIYPQGDETPLKSVEYVEIEAESPEPPEVEATESMFGSVAVEEVVEKTESVFGSTVIEEETEKTESVFGNDVRVEENDDEDMVDEDNYRFKELPDIEFSAEYDSLAHVDIDKFIQSANIPNELKIPYTEFSYKLKDLYKIISEEFQYSRYEDGYSFTDSCFINIYDVEYLLCLEIKYFIITNNFKLTSRLTKIDEESIPYDMWNGLNEEYNYLQNEDESLINEEESSPYIDTNNYDDDYSYKMRSAAFILISLVIFGLLIFLFGTKLFYI